MWERGEEVCNQESGNRGPKNLESGNRGPKNLESGNRGPKILESGIWLPLIHPPPPGRRWNWLLWQFTDKLDANFMVGRRWNWLSWQFTDKLDANFMVGRRWNWLSWQFPDKLDAKYWGVSVKSPINHRTLKISWPWRPVVLHSSVHNHRRSYMYPRHSEQIPPPGNPHRWGFP